MASLRNHMAACLALAALPCLCAAQNVRLRDIARLEGVRSNQLVGYGIVVGLDGSGDSKQTQFTIQSIVNMLGRFGVEVPAGQVKVKNVASVMVTADLPGFARPGDRIDLQVSSMGDARSLQGGTLIQTPLMGADKKVYAVAQGAISLGGFSGGGGGTSVTKNHPTVGRIPNGAVVEKDVPMTLATGSALVFVLSRPDFGTAAKAAAAISSVAGVKAVAEDASRVRVEIPAADKVSPVAFVAAVGDVLVEAAPVGKVVVNERTGTIVIGSAVRLSPVAIAHGGITVAVATQAQVSQPNPLSGGKTTTTTQKSVAVKEDKASAMMIRQGDTVEDLVAALNAIRATPRDIIAILQAIKHIGGLNAELEIL